MIHITLTRDAISYINVFEFPTDSKLMDKIKKKTCTAHYTGCTRLISQAAAGSVKLVPGPACLATDPACSIEECKQNY